MKIKKNKKIIQNKKNEGPRANLKAKNKYKDQDNEKNERPRTKSYLKESLIAVALVASAAGIFFSRNSADFFLLTAEDGGAVINCPNRIPPGNFYLNWQKYTS